MKQYSTHLPTRIEFGCKQFDTLSLHASKIGKFAFVLLDPFLKGSSLEKRLFSQLDAAKVTHIEWYDIVPNPRATTCDAAADLCKVNGCDFIIAVGGGSTIDAAKAVALVVAHGGKSWEYTSRAGKVHLQPNDPGLPLIAVPTAAGTGAEVTPFAVLSNQELKLKATIVNPVIFPKVAIIDPELHLTKPRSLTASTGVDTFLHAFEGFIGNRSNGWTDLFAIRSMELFAKNIRIACNDLQNIQARTQMAESCYMAGVALAGIGVGIPHALGQSLGAIKDTPHGASCAACVIPTIEWTLPEQADRLAQVSRIFDPGVAKLSTLNQAKRLPSLLRSLFADIGLNDTFGSLGLKSSEADLLIDVAFANYGYDIGCSSKQASRADIRVIIENSL